MAKENEIRGVYRPHKPVKKEFKLPSLAKQSFKDECDMETILAKYRKGGMITHFRDGGGSFEDLSGAMEYHDAMNIVVSAQQAFEALPAALRQKFDNNPAGFLAWMHDPENVPEMIDMGLVEPPPPDPAPVVIDPASQTVVDPPVSE